MTFEEMERSIQAHDRQLDTVIHLLADLANRLNGLVRLSEIQNERLTRLEGER